MLFHADDAGCNQVVNKKIIELAQNGDLAGLSIMANMPQSKAFCKAIARQLNLPKINPQIFLHFNAVEGQPVSPVSSVPSLVNHNGSFYPKSIFILRCILGMIKTSELEVELNAQVQVIHRQGLSLSGLDSHQHMHGLNPVSNIFKVYQTKHNIKYIRDYSKMHTQTLTGSLKLRMFGLVCRLSNVRGLFQLPNTWKMNSWQEFCVGSWEELDCDRVGKKVVIMHPGTQFDKSSWLRNLPDEITTDVVKN